MLADIGSASSPSRSRISSPQPRMNDSVYLSPKGNATVRSPVAGLPNPTKQATVYDHITSWFDSVIRARHHRACAISTILSTLWFLLVGILLQFSIWAPFASLTNMCLSLFNWTGYAFMVGYAFAFSITGFVFATVLSSVTRNIKLSLKESSTWVSFVVLVMSNLITSRCLLRSSGYEFDGLRSLVVYCSILAVAPFQLFGSSFQLRFTGVTSNLKISKILVGLFSYPGDSVVSQSIVSTSRFLLMALGFELIFGIFLYGFSSIWVMFDVCFHSALGLIVFSQILCSKITAKLVRQIVMQPITFHLPPAYVVISPSPEQTRSLVNVLGCQQQLLKLFAFFDLKQIAWNDAKRRSDIFSLSQPGGHPRNWNAVSGACLNSVHSAMEMIEAAGNDLGGLTAEEEDEFDINREMLMMPHKARAQLYSSAIRQRHRVAMRAKPIAKIISSPRFKMFSKILRFIEDEKTVLPSYESHLTSLSIDALCMLVVESYTEDRFGVVLKDLSSILRTFLQLIVAIDKYFRVKASCGLDDTDDTCVRQIEKALYAAMYRIHIKFGAHYRSIGLSEEEIGRISTICQSDI